MYKKILILVILIRSSMATAVAEEIPPPPSELPPPPPPEILFALVTNGMPTPSTGTEMGKELSVLGYFLDSRVQGFSGTIFKDEISGWVEFEKIGWAYLPSYKRYDVILYLYSPKMGWLQFGISPSFVKEVYSYTEGVFLFFQKDKGTLIFYYYNPGNSQWRVLEF